MLTHNFNKKNRMDTKNISQSNEQDKIYSSIFFALVNLPYKDNSDDIESIVINGVEYKSYTNYYPFSNGTMTIVKVASTEFVPFGIFPRKIMNFLIGAFAYKKTLPNIYTTEESRRIIHLGETPIDFIEKILGHRKAGSNTRKAILRQLQAILNCQMAIATGYQQLNPKNDELFADNRYQFAFIESDTNQLVNHKFDVYKNWQPNIAISQQLSEAFSKKIMPLMKEVYMQITKPMELDAFQYFSYQGHAHAKNNDFGDVKEYWDHLFKRFGRGYANTSKGIAGFRRDLRNSLKSLQKKTNLYISAPLNSKFIIFRPQPLSITEKLVETQPDINDSINQNLQNPITIESAKTMSTSNEWDNFVKKYNLQQLDKSALTVVKQHFKSDIEHTIKTVEYAKIQNPRNLSAYIISALKEDWIHLNSDFKNRLESWKVLYEQLDSNQKHSINNVVANVMPGLRDKWQPEQIDSTILAAIYARYLVDMNRDSLLKELNGSRYQTYFMNNFDLTNIIEPNANVVQNKQKEAEPKEQKIEKEQDEIAKNKETESLFDKLSTEDRKIYDEKADHITIEISTREPNIVRYYESAHHDGYFKKMMSLVLFARHKNMHYRPKFQEMLLGKNFPLEV